MDPNKPIDLATAQEAVVAIWIEVLELDNLDPNDDFYDIGGDSLSAIQILSRIQQKFGVKVSEAEFFSARTVAGLCRFLEQAKARTEVAGVRLELHAGSRERFPTTSSQQRLWVLDQFIANPEVYNIAFLVQMKGSLSVEVLGRALEAVVNRHEVYRTHLEADNGVPVQVVAGPAEAFDFPIIDLKHLPYAERLKEAQKQSIDDAATPMDLSKPPLWKFRLYLIGPDDYALYLLTHHVLTDGWSWGVFFKDLETYYDAFKDGKEPKLAPLPVQFGDFAIWQRAWMKSPAFRQQVEHWKKVLAPPIATLDLPISKPRPRNQTFHGETIKFTLPRKLINAMDKFGRMEAVTRFMIGLAAFQTVLHRYSGQDDMLVGTPVAARNQQEIEPLIGFFVNTLILRTNLGGDPTFRELLERIRQVRLDAFTHQDIPLEALIEELQPPRDTSRQPFFQIAFLYQNMKMVPDRFARMKLTGELLHNRTAMFDLRLVMEDGPYDSLWAWIEFNTDLFEKAAMERLAQHFLTVLEAAVANPSEKIARLPMLTADERKLIVQDWNNTAGDYPGDVCIHEGFEQRTRQTPDAVAVVAGDKEFSYRALNERANRLARLLRAQGVGRGTFVGICLRRSEEMIVAALAVLKAGGAYVPLDSSYPKDRIAFMIEDTKAPVVLTQTGLLDRLPDETQSKERYSSPTCFADDPAKDTSARYLCLDRMSDELAKYDATDLDRINQPDDLAYIIFTSGSTGRPKGVMLRHRPVMNVLDWVSTSFNVTPSDRLLFVTSLSFDLSVYDIFGVLGAGGSLRVATEDELRDPARLLQILKTEPITIWDSAPAALQQVVPFFSLKKSEDKTDRLRLVMLSGDWIPVPLPDQVRATFPNARMISLGGATEAAIWSNWYPIEKVDPKWPSIPYGKPIRNGRYYILDKNLQPVPVGVPGELHIGGEVLADGYFHREELTAERFIPDPFHQKQPPHPGPLPRSGGEGENPSSSLSHASGERAGVRGSSASAKMYKTGDLARFFPDGNIEFLGRIDSQVKVRGFRVEAGEIEAVLASHPAVLEGVIRPHRDTGGHLFLCAYVVLRDGQAATSDELSQHLQAKLPEYMVPAHFVFLDKMPLTPNGKVDRSALLAPKLDGPRSQRAFEPPADSIEEGVAAIWSEVLGVEKVGRRDNFFEMGGHSLRGAQLVARIQEQFQVPLRLAVVFEKPTVAGMAEAVKEAGVNPAALQPAIRRHEGIQDRGPLSLIQQRFWFIDRTIPDRGIYNVNDRFRIHGPLNADAIRQAWNAVVARQESLRTIFTDTSGTELQVVLPTVPGELAVIDLSDSPAEVNRRIAREAWKPFDLKQAPLWRAYLYRLSDTEHVFHWNLHHIIMDESSRVVLLRDLWTAYERAVAEVVRLPDDVAEVVRLPDLAVRYTDFAATQRAQLDDKGLEPQLAYWKERLTGAATPAIPPHLKPRPTQRTFTGALLRFDLPQEIARGITALSRSAGVTPFIAYLAAFQTLLMRYWNQPDICVGTPVSNRPASGARDIAGCFVNTVPVRTDLSGDPSFRDVLGRVREAMAGALEHGETPFEKIIEAVRPERIPGGHPLFQAMFVYQNEELRGSAPGGLTWEMEQTDHVGAKFDFTMAVEDRPGRLAAQIEYSTELYDEETVRRVSAHLLTLLESIVAKPDAPITDLAILPETERKLVVETWNANVVAFPRDHCVHQLIEERVAQTPDAVAFEHQGRALTYREWNEQANRLAGYLRAHGVGPDVPVAVCVERSFDMPVALLAVLKAGGGYAPFDPSHPADRLAFMIRDTKAPVLITQSHLAEKLPREGTFVACLDQLTSELEKQSPETPACIAQPGNLFAAIYTSGSTGRPKGVALHHRGAVSLLHAMRQRITLTPDDLCLAVSTYSFDIHILDFWWAPFNGVKVIIAQRDVAVDGAKMAEMIEQTGATVMSVTPATWRLLIEANWKGAPKMKAICGGEAITAEMSRQMIPRVADFWNIYGPTETTVFVLWHRVDDPTKAPPVGRPVANSRIFIVDPKMHPAPIGGPGEIYIGGTNVGLGYLHQPEMTRERYLPNPFAKPDRMDDSVLYKTGDLGRYLADGTVEVLGRVDFQVKIRGFRIELGEIEQVLEEHPGVRQAVVVARKNAAGLDALYAYFLAKAMPATTPADLRRYLLAKLPDYMVPATFVAMEQFPQTPNRKVDRQALPDPQPHAHATAGREIVGPANDAERALKPIWEEVFGIEPIGVTDSFHDLGGHSLLAAVLMSRIESRLGHRVPLEALFETPTIRGIANRIQEKLELTTGSVLVPLQTTGDHPPLFLIAGAGGHVFAFHKFARMLGPQFNVYGMKAVGVDGTEEPLDSIEAIAERYFKEITTVCPNGPYVLGGYSVGGLIAFELALRMQAAGKQVAGVILFDLNGPGYPKPLPLHRRMWVHAKTFLRKPWGEKWGYLRQRFIHIKERVLYWMGKHHAAAPDVPGMDIVPQERLKRVWGGLLKAAVTYWPVRPFDGELVLIGSSLPLDWVGHQMDDPLKGWARWATKPVKLYQVPAPHMDVFRDEYLDLLTAQVREVLSEAKGPT